MCVHTPDRSKIIRWNITRVHVYTCWCIVTHYCCSAHSKNIPLVIFPVGSKSASTTLSGFFIFNFIKVCKTLLRSNVTPSLDNMLVASSWHCSGDKISVQHRDTSTQAKLFECCFELFLLCMLFCCFVVLLTIEKLLLQNHSFTFTCYVVIVVIILYPGLHLLKKKTNFPPLFISSIPHHISLLSIHHLVIW